MIPKKKTLKSLLVPAGPVSTKSLHSTIETPGNSFLRTST
jgi:hypothetical protein